MDIISNILDTFKPVFLDEMDSVKLLNRTDTKFIMHEAYLFEILPGLNELYKVLECNNVRTNTYNTVYFDTSDLECYLHHHSGRLNRIKVRIRKYADSGMRFLEVKLKNNKFRTVKSRIRLNGHEKPDTSIFSEMQAKYPDLDFSDLQETLKNQFKRITLVHKHKKERVTIDYNIVFGLSSNYDIQLKNIVIVEVKQEGHSVRSDFIRRLKEYQIHPDRISKYCIGMALLNRNLKRNRFKPKLMELNKISDGIYSGVL